jgi:hypothetical protein
VEEVPFLTASQRLCPPFATMQELATNVVARYATRDALGVKKVRKARRARERLIYLFVF